MTAVWALTTVVLLLAALSTACRQLYRYSRRDQLPTLTEREVAIRLRPTSEVQIYPAAKPPTAPPTTQTERDHQ